MCRENNFLKELNEGKWIVWGGAAIPKEDVLSGKQQLGINGHIFTPEELGLTKREKKKNEFG
jgi:hypothetical protein